MEEAEGGEGYGRKGKREKKIHYIEVSKNTKFLNIKNEFRRQWRNSFKLLKEKIQSI